MSRSLMLNRLKKKSHYLTRLVTVRDYTHMTSMKIVQVSGPPLSLSIYIQNSSTPWPWTSNFKQTSPFPNDNQSIKKSIIQGLLPVDTRRRFNVDTTSYDIVRRRIDVENTSCVYGAIIFYKVLDSGRLSFSVSTH